MNEQDHELIERYLSGDMDEAARAAFEGRLEREPELMQTLRDWRDVQETLRHSLQPDTDRDELKKNAAFPPPRDHETAFKGSAVQPLADHRGFAGGGGGAYIVFQPLGA